MRPGSARPYACRARPVAPSPPLPRPQASSAQAAAEAARLHGEFMGMVRQLIDGALDPSTFEDKVGAGGARTGRGWFKARAPPDRGRRPRGAPPES
jgi:hypothetical protein